jgi:hypothetical protein
MPGPSPIANQFRSNFGEQRGGGTPLAKSLGSAPGPTGAASELFFPGDVEQLDHWCAVRIFKQQLMQRKDTPIKNDIARVFLPMPQQLTTGYNHGYNAESLGPAGAVGASLGAAGAQGGIKAITDKITSAMTKEGAKGAAAGAGYYLSQAAESGGLGIAGAASKVPIIGSVLGAAVGPAVKGAMGGAGIARNPFMALLYDAPAMREHSFSWKLVARNYAESNTIYNIIKLFKYHAAPGRSNLGDVAGQSVFLTYPEQFDIDFHHKEFLYNIAPSVLKGFSVNYHPDGTQYHVSPDGTEKAPISVQIEMQLQEVAIITKENINADNR